MMTTRECPICKSTKVVALGEPQKRPTWYDYFLSIASIVATRSTCLRHQYGAVVVDHERTIISTGYNGAPSGVQSCYDKGSCYRERNNIPSGTRYETCYSVHAEMNAIIRARSSVRDCTLYIGSLDNQNNIPCDMCRRIMVNAEIRLCIFRHEGGIVAAEPGNLQFVRFEEVKHGQG